MKILYAIQGTGNGHVSRAREIIPHLEKYGEVDLLISGTQADVSLTQPLRWKLHGFSFVFGKKGGVDRWRTWKIMDLRRLWQDIKMLPLEQYNLIINDFEPVSAWACKKRGVPNVALSHQAAFLSSGTPRPERLFPHWNELLFRYYAPADRAVAFHFESYDDFIHTPVIRSEIRSLKQENKGHYTVYLPAHDDRLVCSWLTQIRDVEWQVFSKHTSRYYTQHNVLVQPIDNEAFNKSLSTCEGLLTAGGFESPAEALFMKKKVFSVPMMGQWEQQCNAEAMKRMGIPVQRKKPSAFVGRLRDWVKNGEVIPVDYPDATGKIIQELVTKHAH